MKSYGPEFRWFAWYPVNTQDRGWRWLRMVWTRRVWWEIDSRDLRYWEHSVEGF